MNQILAFGHIGKSENQLKKIIRFFSFFIIIFAIILIVEGFFGYKKNKEKKIYVDRPNIDVLRNGDITTLNIASEVGIQKVIYSWNDGLANIIEKNGENNFSVEIETTIGTNDLNLEIKDSKGNSIIYDPIKISYDEQSDGESNANNGAENGNWQDAVSQDTTEPVLSLAATKGKITINASDEVRMSYVTYSWNGGEETKITGLSNDEKSLYAEIDVLKGDNKLTVKAYDKAGNVKTIEKDVHGTDGPQITAKSSKDEIIITIEDQFGITKVSYNFNGEEKTIDNINEKKYEIRLKLIEGDNYVIVNAYENNVKSEYKGRKTYSPQN